MLPATRTRTEGGRVLSSRRPPARVWLPLAVTFQPGLTDALSESTVKEALVAGVAEMGGDVTKLGPVWGDSTQTLKAWRSARVSVELDWGGGYGQGVLGVDEDGLPTRLFLDLLNLRGPLSDQVCRLTSLTLLHLDNNHLTSLPNAIGRLTSLEILHMAGNQLTSLPDSIGRLASLTTIHLDGNRLASLPDSIYRLTTLKTLSLGVNRLTELLDAIGGLTNLKTLILIWNRISDSEKLRIRFIKDRCFPLCELRL